MRFIPTVTVLALVLGAAPAPSFAQPASPQPAASEPPAPPAAAAAPVIGPILLTPALLAGLPRQSVSVTDEHNGPATYQGVSLAAVLARAGVPQGKALRGPLLAGYAVAVASDGYRVVFALPELDPAFTARLVLLADARNGAPLDAKLGPYRIVIPDELRQARWIRNVTEIDIRSAP